MCLCSSAILFRVRRKPAFALGGSIVALSTFTLGLHAYLKDNFMEDGESTSPIFTWIPMVAIVTMYTGFSGKIYKVYSFQHLIGHHRDRMLDGCNVFLQLL